MWEEGKSDWEEKVIKNDEKRSLATERSQKTGCIVIFCIIFCHQFSVKAFVTFSYMNTCVKPKHFEISAFLNYGSNHCIEWKKNKHACIFHSFVTQLYICVGVYYWLITPKSRQKIILLHCIHSQLTSQITWLAMHFNPILDSYKNCD